MKHAQISDTITQIISLLNRDLSDDNLIQKMVEMLQKHIPCQRVSLGLHILDRWYLYQSGQLILKPSFFSDRNKAIIFCNNAVMQKMII